MTKNEEGRESRLKIDLSSLQKSDLSGVVPELEEKEKVRRFSSIEKSLRNGFLESFE